jgi:hypothetical protein
LRSGGLLSGRHVESQREERRQQRAAVAVVNDGRGTAVVVDERSSIAVVAYFRRATVSAEKVATLGDSVEQVRRCGGQSKRNLSNCGQSQEIHRCRIEKNEQQRLRNLF